jgi:hypothetical protein
MKQFYMDFVQQAQSQVPDAMLRSRVVAAAVAVAISMSQSLPSGEVSHAGEYFTNQVMPAAQRIISEFNENLVFDTHAALMYTRQLWQLRYWSAFQQMQSVKLVNNDFFGSFTGVNALIADNFRVFMGENAEVVTNLSYFATDAIGAQAASVIG